MAAVVFAKAKEQFLQGGINLSTANVKVVAVDLADYTFVASHEFLSDIAAGGRVATSANLASKTFANGTFDAADTSFTAATGDPFEALVGYVDTGTATTSRLLWFDDAFLGNPTTPNGQDIAVVFNAAGIFSL